MHTEIKKKKKISSYLVLQEPALSTEKDREYRLMSSKKSLYASGCALRFGITLTIDKISLKHLLLEEERKQK